METSFRFVSGTNNGECRKELIMHIVIAPDSYKGSLTSLQVSEIMKRAIKDVNKRIRVTMKPMADGGEGTVDSLLTANKGERIPIECTGPLGEKIHTTYGIVEAQTAIIECASIAGLVQVPVDHRNLDSTTSYGMGEAINDALHKGCTSFVIGLGGSATNDGGLGMLLALGMKAWDEQGNAVGPFGKDVHNVKKVSFSNMNVRLNEAEIKVACDVDNPLCGEKGATAVYGPQKGATKGQIAGYDQALNGYGDVIESAIGKAIKDVPGAGAAGGLGFALLSLGATLVSGAELLADAMYMEAEIQTADFVITGEGKSDEQTLYGKAPGYIAGLAKKYHVPTILISGSLDGNLDTLREQFAGCFSIVNKPLALEICMDQADRLLYEQTKQVVHLITAVNNS